MGDWSAAEFRARLYGLGLTVKGFSDLTGRNQRGVERAAVGISERVSATMIEQVEALEARARADLADWDDATEERIRISIPRLNQPAQAGELPPHWYLALAARHIEKWGTDAQIEWVET